ncbi:MAG: Do family serine endopeptidase [Gammaproteobacteria bacterium]|nr:MAG: Do family serine endopeptidase [Gammaproteobacteria bacterium]
MLPLPALRRLLLTSIKRKSAFVFFALVMSVPALAISGGAIQSLPDFNELVEQSGPAVVNIRVTQKVSAINERPQLSPEEEELFERYFGQPSPHSKKDSEEKPEAEPDAEQISRSVGSGFIFSSDGYVLTNAHVVKNAEEVFVKLTDKREFRAKLIGFDTNTDVAVLKVEGQNLPKVTLGDSTKIKVGEWVIAIGSPFDLDNSISAGIISAKAREIGDFLLLIQTDVAINPGNSGGPLINLKGEVIGINSQIYSRSGGYMGISFAIPIDDAIRVAEQLKVSGKVSRGRMGIYLSEVNENVAEALKLPNKNGTLVSRIEKNGPAEKAGLKDGDIVLSFDGTSVEKSTELRRLAAATKPGSTVNLKIWRKGVTKDYPITLAELPQTETAPIEKTQKEKKTTGKPHPTFGLTVRPLDSEQKKEYGISSGVTIEKAEGVSARAGLQTGDIILTINNQDITDGRAFEKIIEKAGADKSIVVLARRENITQYIAIKNP